MKKTKKTEKRKVKGGVSLEESLAKKHRKLFEQNFLLQLREDLESAKESQEAREKNMKIRKRLEESIPIYIG